MSMILYGKNSVYERLKRCPKSIKKIMLQDNFKDARIEKLIKTNNISFSVLSFKEMDRIKNAKKFQGIIAEINQFQYTPFEDISSSQNIIFLDRITDPHNLGVIMRTAACFGRFAIVIPKHSACEVNETVLHVASGGENYLSVSKVTNLSAAILEAKEKGYWILGAVVSEEAENINEIELPFPLGLVLGSEGEGIRYGLLKHLDIKARIPMNGAKLSFNVNMACAIFCHEISKKISA